MRVIAGLNNPEKSQCVLRKVNPGFKENSCDKKNNTSRFVVFISVLYNQ